MTEFLQVADASNCIRLCSVLIKFIWMLLEIMGLSEYAKGPRGDFMKEYTIMKTALADFQEQ